MAAALSLPNTGQAITIDVGEAGDIHPRNKLDVGGDSRALRSRPSTDAASSRPDPPYRLHRVLGDIDRRVDFANANGGLAAVSSADGRQGAFAIAGARTGNSSHERPGQTAAECMCGAAAVKAPVGGSIRLGKQSERGELLQSRQACRRPPFRRIDGCWSPDAAKHLRDFL